MPDLASLSFDIDSTQAQRAVAALEALKASSISVVQSTNQVNTANQSLTQSYSQQRDALGQLADQTRNYDGTLTGLITRLNTLRTGIDGSRMGMAAYTATMRDATAASQQFNATIEGLDRYVSKTRELNIVIRDTATGLQTITAAQQNLTVSGNNARVALEGMGVTMAALNSNNPAAVLEQLATRLRGVRASQATLNQAQQILGPSFTPQAYQSLTLQPYIPAEQRTATQLAASTAAQIDMTRQQNDRRSADETRIRAELADLRSRYSQDPTLAGRLGIPRAATVQRFFGQTQDQELAELRRINQLPEAQRRAYTGPVARNIDEFQTGYVGQTIRAFQTHSASQADIITRFNEESRSQGFIPATGNFLTRTGQNLPWINRYQPRTEDERPVSAEELRERRRGSGDIMAGYGDTALSGEVATSERARLFDTGDMRQRYIQEFGPIEGARRFDNQRGANTLAARYAARPEEQIADQTARQRDILAAAPEDRARAQFMQTFRAQQVGTTGTLSDRQTAVGEGAFRQGVSAELQERSEDVKRQIDFQRQLAAELTHGRAAAEDFTRAWVAYNQARQAGATEDQAQQQGIEQVGLALRQRITQATNATEMMREQNRLLAERSRLAESTRNMDPVSRAVMASGLAIQQQIESEKSAGTLPNTAGGFFGNRYVSASPDAERAINARADVLREQNLQQARQGTETTLTGLTDQVRDSETLVRLMEERGISLAKANDLLQLQKKFVEELAAAEATGDSSKIEASRQRLALAEQLQRVNTAEAQRASNVEIGRNAMTAGNQAAAISALPLDQQEQARRMMPWIEQQRRAGTTGAQGEAPLWIDRPEARPYLPQIYEHAQRTGLPPALIAETIGQESGFKNVATQILGKDGKPVSTAGGFGQQIDGNVYLHGGNKFDPNTSIAATAEEVSARLRAAGGNVETAMTGYGTIGARGGSTDAQSAAKLAALQRAAGQAPDGGAAHITENVDYYRRGVAGQLPPDVQRVFDQQNQGATLERQAAAMHGGQILRLQQTGRDDRLDLIRRGQTGDAARVALPTTGDPLTDQLAGARQNVETGSGQREQDAANSAALRQRTEDNRRAAAATAEGEKAAIAATLAIKGETDARTAGSGVVDQQARAIENLNAMISDEIRAHADTTKALNDQIAVQEKVNASILKGSEAQRDAEAGAQRDIDLRHARAELQIAEEQHNAAGAAMARDRIKTLEDEGAAQHTLNVARERGQALQDVKQLTNSSDLQQALNARGAFASPSDLRHTEANERLRQRFRDEPGLENSPEGQQLKDATARDQAIKDQTERMAELRDAAKSTENAMISALDAVVVHGAKGSDAIKGLGTALEEIILKTVVYKPLERLMDSAMTDLFGGQGPGDGSGKGGGGGGGGLLSGGGGGGLLGGIGKLLGLGGGGGGANDNRPGSGGGAVPGSGSAGAMPSGGGSGGLLSQIFSHAGGATGWGVDQLGGQGFYKGGGLIGSLFGGGGGGGSGGGSGGTYSDPGSSTQYRYDPASDMGGYSPTYSDPGSSTQYMYDPSADVSGGFGGGFDVAAAKGGVFPRSALAAYEHSIVTQPTMFRFARGGQTGLMGEAGPEAIIPLSRGADGKLGIQGGGGGGGGVTFNISTPDADSFRRSQPQIQARANAALTRTQQRTG